MSEWKEIEIGNLAYSFAGGTPSRAKSEYFGGSIPWISSSEVNQPYITEVAERITEKGLKYSSAKWVPSGSVLVAMYGATAGQIAYLRIRATTNQAVLALIPRESEIDSEFLYYQTKFNKDKILYYAQGSGQPNLNKRIIDRTSLLVPSLPVQRKIARILSTIDGQIEKTEAIIAKYQAIKQGMLQDLFTRGIDVRTGQLRPRYEDAPDLYKESALGMIPTEWESTTIGKSCLIQNQFRKPISAEIRETMQGKYPYYGPTGIQDYIDEFRVEGKYVLIGEDGDHFLKWSKQEMTILTDGKFNVNNHAHILEGTEGCLTEWIHIFFSHEDITFYLTRQGAGRYKLNKATLKVIEFPLPRVDEQKMIIERLMSINNQIKLDKKNLSKLQLLKQGLMHDLLSGTVVVEA